MSDAAERERSRFRKMTEGDPSLIDRNKWPEDLRGASGMDAFIIHCLRAWPMFFGGEEEIERVFDHDMGFIVYRRGEWELTLVNMREFSGHAFDANTQNPSFSPHEASE